MTVPILSASRKGNVPTRDEHWSRERATFLRRSESSRCLIPPGPDPAASAASSSGFSPPSPRTNCTSACSSRTPAAGSSRIHVISLSALGRFSPGRWAGLVWTAEGSKSCRVSEPGTPQPKGASFCTRLQVLARPCQPRLGTRYVVEESTRRRTNPRSTSGARSQSSPELSRHLPLVSSCAGKSFDVAAGNPSDGFRPVHAPSPRVTTCTTH